MSQWRATSIGIMPSWSGGRRRRLRKAAPKAMVWAAPSFILDSDGGGTAGDTYYTPEQLERVREAEARRPQLEKEAAERSARMEEVGRELHEFYQSEECQQFYRELLKIKQAHEAG